MIIKLRTFLLTTDAVTSISVDGMSASYDRKGAWDMLKELEREERNIVNPNRYRKHVDLQHAFE